MKKPNNKLIPLAHVAVGDIPDEYWDKIFKYKRLIEQHTKLLEEIQQLQEEIKNEMGIDPGQ